MGKVVNNFRALIEKRYGVSSGARLPTIAKLSEDIGISQAAVLAWLSGDAKRFDRVAIEKICKFLRCKVGDLLDYQPDAGEREHA